MAGPNEEDMWRQPLVIEPLAAPLRTDATHAPTC
jgi:hypothetical protein